MPTKTDRKTGAVYRSEERYVRKIGTHIVYCYTPELMQRGDMEYYDPFTRQGDGMTPVKHPDLDPAEYASQQLEAEFKKDRAEIRADLKQYQLKIHKIFYALNLIWNLEPIHDLPNFQPVYAKVCKIVGPTFTKDDLTVALNVFKQNTNLEFLTSEAAHELIENSQLDFNALGRHEGTIPVERRGADGLLQSEVDGTVPSDPDTTG